MIGVTLATKFTLFKKIFSLESYAQKLASRQIVYRLLSDAIYSSLIKQLDTAPIVLYIKGNVTIVSSNTRRYIGIVGSTINSTYGKEITQNITRDLVAAGIITVFGLALGIDAIVHEATMDLGGQTIAVPGWVLSAALRIPIKKSMIGLSHKEELSYQRVLLD